MKQSSLTFPKHAVSPFFGPNAGHTTQGPSVYRSQPEVGGHVVPCGRVAEPSEHDETVRCFHLRLLVALRF